MAKKRPMPGEAPNYQERNKGRFSWDTEGLMEGGGPRSDKSIKGASDLDRMAGGDNTPYGRAIQSRQKNIEGHNKATDKAKAAIKKDVLKSKASSPKASKYDKLRYKVYELTGFKNGGSVSKRADGCATKGKTKGRFV